MRKSVQHAADNAVADAPVNQGGTKPAAGKPTPRLIRLQQEAAAHERRLGVRERAVLVAVEFTTHSGKSKLTPSAKMARGAASVVRDATDAPASDALPAAEPAEAHTPDADFEAAVAEFRELAVSAGAEVAALLVQRRGRPDPATLIGGGKLDEIAEVATSTNADIVLFDHDLTPSQLRNLEARLPCRVIDRTQLILDIFARHARTREGQLQVELAQLQYILPRLAGSGSAMSQLGGGIGTRGPGETKLETDRRKINRRMDQVKEQLEGVRRVRRQQRQRREAVPVPTVALVGYTNAGKSTLFNALTQAGVLESARMFATLDPKLRAITLPSRRRVLLSDTVGFIRNLPHTLVTSFRATLEEVEKAEVLVHVRDAASPLLDEQKAEVEKVLGELHALDKPVIEVMNKIDLLDTAHQSRLRALHDVVAVSARDGIGLDALLAKIDLALTADPLVTATFRIPQAQGAILAALEGGAVVEEKSFEGNLVTLRVRGPASLLERYRSLRSRQMG